MTRTDKLPRAIRSFTAALALTLALVASASASASVASEQQQGAQTLKAIQAGELNGKNLSNSQYEHVGEYLMSRALGSNAAHQRMNSLMDQMMGQSGYLSGRSHGNGNFATGPGMMGTGFHSSSGWPSGAIVAICVLAALLLAGGIVAAMSTRRHRGERPRGRPA